MKILAAFLLILLTLTGPVSADENHSSFRRYSLGLKVGPNHAGAEAGFAYTEQALIAFEYDRKGRELFKAPFIESSTVGLRRVFSGIWYIQLGLSYTALAIYGKGNSLEVIREYIGVRAALGLQYRFGNLQLGLRFLGFDSHLRTAREKSVFEQDASLSLPGRYGEIMTLTGAYFFW